MNKKKSIIILLAMSIAIVLSGILYSVYSYMANVKFQVLNTNVPGYVFGLIAIFLGVRYFRSLKKLKKNISNSELTFSWENFKKADKVTGKC